MILWLESRIKSADIGLEDGIIFHTKTKLKKIHCLEVFHEESNFVRFQGKRAHFIILGKLFVPE